MTIITRHRGSTASALALAVLLALTACASPTGTAPEGPDAAGLLPPAEGTTQYPLTVTSAVGEIVIEQRPERVVMASSWDADLFAALGVVPVGTDEQVDFYPWAIEAFPQEIETLWPVGDEPYPAEQIASTTPQLIVDTAATEASAVERIGAIAPVLGAPEAEGEDATWQQRILLLGEALDLSDRAQQVVDDYDTAFEEFRAQYPEFAGKSVDYLVFWGGDYGTGFINTAGSDAEALLVDLGFVTNANAGDAAFEENFSEELFGTLTGDVLVISDQGDAAEFEEFLAHPLIQGLESVQNDRVVVLHVGDDFTVTHDGEPTEFTGHFGRAFSLGPLSKLKIANLLTPLISEVLPKE